MQYGAGCPHSHPLAPAHLHLHSFSRQTGQPVTPLFSPRPLPGPAIAASHSGSLCLPVGLRAGCQLQCSALWGWAFGVAAYYACSGATMSGAARRTVGSNRCETWER